MFMMVFRDAFLALNALLNLFFKLTLPNGA